MSRNIIIKDRFFQNDKIMNRTNNHGLFARTEIIGGYDLRKNPTGKSTLGEVLFRQHNMVPIGGVSYAFEKLYGISDIQLQVPTLYDQTGIGHSNSEPSEEVYLTPEGTKSIAARPSNMVQLFGLGITGNAENDISVYDVGYRENSINLSKIDGASGLTITGTMLPFRYTSSSLNSTERQIYFGKKYDGDEGITSYYLKRFSSDPTIKHVWDVGIDDEEEELVSSNDVWDDSNDINGITSFVEMYLTIGKKDVREYFSEIGDVERARFNTIALYTGEYVVDDESGDDGEYRDVRLFSKFCIPPEFLSVAKDLSMVYRVYGV